LSNILRASAGSKEPVDIRGVPFGGVRPDKAPSHLSPTDFISLENVRRIGGLILNRPGQTAFAEVVSADPTGMYDFQVGGAAGMGAGSGGGLFLTVSNGIGNDMLTLNQYDPAQKPTLQVRQDITALVTGAEMRTTRVLIEGVDNYPTVDCLVVAKNKLTDAAAIVCKLEALTATYSISADAIGAQITPLFTLPQVAGVNYSQIDAMVQYSGKLFVTATSFAGTAWAVFSWDGQTCNFERTLTGALGSACVVFRDSLVVFADTNMHIRNQAGTWSTVATGAVATSTVNPNCVEIYRDLLYFVPSGLITGTFGVVAPTPDHVPSIYSFDGTTVSIITSATTGIGEPTLNKSRICGLAVFNKILYVSWGQEDDASGFWTEMNIATFDGTTWTAIHKTFPAGADAIECQIPIRAFQGCLFIGIDPGMQKSPKTDTAGTWTPITLAGTLYQTNLEIH
jgi:hypothetical protein